MDLVSLRQECEKARRVLEENGECISKDYFGDFPRGACGNASCFLAQWLGLKKVREVKYVCGNRGNSSHAWLEINNCIIDITADQFPDGPGPVFIGRGRDFHDQFENQEEGDSSISAVLYQAFARFRELMEQA